MSDDWTAADTLKAARALIEDPEHWTQEVYARDRDGNAVDPRGDEAVCFCAAGTFYRVFQHGRQYGRPWGDGADILVSVLGADIVWFNDAHTHSEVLSAFDKAIALAETK